MSIKYAYLWRDESVRALLKLKGANKTYDNRVLFKKFCDAFDVECKNIRESVIQPNLELLNSKNQDAVSLKEINDFLNKESDLKPLPVEFHEIMKGAILSEIDEEFLNPLIAEIPKPPVKPQAVPKPKD